MNKLIYSLCCLLVVANANSQSVGIGTNTPDSGAVLDVASASKAIIIPRLSATAIATLPAKDGMLLFNTDTKAFMGYSSGGKHNAINQLAANSGHPLNIASVGQSFTPAFSFKLEAIGLALEKFGNSAYLHISLFDGNPDGTRLLSTDYRPDSSGVHYIPTGGTLTLQEGHLYSIAIQQITGDMSTNYVGIYYNATDVYNGGTMFKGSSITNGDLYFVVRSEVKAGWKTITQ